MALRPDADIAQRLREACDTTYYNALYRDQCYAFGDNPRAVAVSGSPGTMDEHPDYPAVHITRQEAGKSRRIMNAAFVHLSKIATGRAEPEFPQVDKWTGEVRKQFYIERTRGGQYGDEAVESWGDENAMMFLEGDQLGVGFVQWQFKRNPLTKRFYVCGRHSPSLLTLWDPHARHPGRARYWAPVLYIPEDEAVRRWGADTTRDLIQTYFDDYSEHGIKAVKVYWYEDSGDEQYEPTISVIPLKFTAKPLKKYTNPTGRLNMSYYVHWVAPGMRRPIGRIPAQTATQEVLNIMEARMLRTLKRPHLDVLDLSGIDIKEYNQYLAGKRDWVAAKGLDVTKAATRLPGSELNKDFGVLHDWYENQYRADSGTADYDYGSKPEGVETKFEAGLIDQRGQITNVWARMQYLASQIRSVSTCLRGAAVGDRDPITLDVFGYNVPVNSDDPRSWIDGFLDEPSRIIINEDTLDVTARDARRQQRVNALQVLESGLATMGGPIDPVWYWEEMLKAIGEQDPKEAFIPGVAGTTAGVPGVEPIPGMPTPEEMMAEAGQMGGQPMNSPVPTGSSAPPGA